MQRVPFRCPETREPLSPAADGLSRADGRLYPYLPGTRAPFFGSGAGGEAEAASLGMYQTEVAVASYRNFLDWLFATFRVEEAGWRRDMVGRLRVQAGGAVLVTGCGLGDDLGPIAERLGPSGEIHAQDLSAAMVRQVATGLGGRAQPVHLSCGTALRLPYGDGVFDAAFHFGGINLFDDIRAGIAEMSRVVRPGGRVVFGDEGIAPWLRDTDYGRMVVANIPLWASQAPLAHLPPSAGEVSIEWILGSCFWLISYTVAEGLPAIDPHVPHKGRRGGTMWTRYRGQLEGVSEATREGVLRAAEAAGVSTHQWLETVLGEALRREPHTSRTATPKPDRP